MKLYRDLTNGIKIEKAFRLRRNAVHLHNKKIRYKLPSKESRFLQIVGYAALFFFS